MSRLTLIHEQYEAASRLDRLRSESPGLFKLAALAALILGPPEFRPNALTMVAMGFAKDMVAGRNPFQAELDLLEYYRSERDAVLRWEDDGGLSAEQESIRGSYGVE